MALPTPVQGLVIRYSYLWRSEYLQGREEGVKDRPCAVILVVTDDMGDAVVTVLPITHSTPADPTLAVEIPTATKARLGLDMDRSWVILSEANRFIWPGPDLRPAQGRDIGSVAFGLLPYKLMEEIRTRFLALVRERRCRPVPRAE